MNKEFNVPPIWFKIRDLYRIIFVDFWHKLKRSISWFLFMWDNNNWGHIYLYKVMDKKMGELEYNFIKYGHLHNSKRYAKIINICRWYLQRLIKEDIIDSLQDKHINKYGNSKMILEDHPDNVPGKAGLSVLKGWKYSKCETEEQNEYAHKVFIRICLMERYLYKKYYVRFFYIFKKYVQYWWD
jgi:hypothetical protein